MRILGIDTSTMAGSVALVEKTTLKGEVNIHCHLTHSKRLLPSINFLLKNLGISLDQIDALGVAVGPGSFTGLRIGISTVKGLASARGMKICPVITLEAMSFKVRHYNKIVYPMVNAGRGEVYAGKYRVAGDTIKRLSPDLVISPEKFLAGIDSWDAVFYGDGAISYRELINRFSRGKALIAPDNLFLGEAIALIAARKLALGKTVTLAQLTPYYIRPSDAELKKFARGFTTGKKEM
ncbi:tRNA (adenosine(37)-N6)-threonylcarbamoyltransferase complex dimerization subunit type 1 TsaB [bacterium (candidate division B38) B3_B38]|nr:MAG: tRNA (adenosine(37)-N6)-threonylcarbamoyltransferase complex dimerization subunit type 1 TsaB [bacterium (candidate division B38) B3_B38]